MIFQKAYHTIEVASQTDRKGFCGPDRSTSISNAFAILPVKTNCPHQPLPFHLCDTKTEIHVTKVNSLTET